MYRCNFDLKAFQHDGIMLIGCDAGSFRVGSSCWDIQTNQGASRSGIYFVQPPSLSQGPWRVLCDLETDGGNWTVFQVRDNVEPQENFNRNWDDYKVQDRTPGPLEMKTMRMGRLISKLNGDEIDEKKQ